MGSLLPCLPISIPLLPSERSSAPLPMSPRRPTQPLSTPASQPRRSPAYLRLPLPHRHPTPPNATPRMNPSCSPAIQRHRRRIPATRPHLLVHRLPHRPATRRCPNPAAPGRRSGELLPSRSSAHPSGRRTPTSSSRRASAIVTRGRPTCCFCCCSPPTQRRRCRRWRAFTKLLVDPGSAARRVARSLASFGWR